jgi:predicted lysophospholipase L1 biosynthesis ABC-type transport system permease subunit
MKDIGTSMPFTFIRFVSCKNQPLALKSNKELNTCFHKAFGLFFTDIAIIILVAGRAAVPFVCLTIACSFVQRYLRRAMRHAESNLRMAKATISNYCLEVAKRQ